MFRSTKETPRPATSTPAPRLDKADSRPSRNGPTQETTQVSLGAGLSGKLQTTGSLVVDGRVEGNICAHGDVQIGATGVVEAEIEGRNVTVAGKVKGRIFAEGKVVLVSGSHVEGDIHAQSLKIEDAVFFQGGCVMGEGARREKAEDAPLPKTVSELKAA